VIHGEYNILGVDWAPLADGINYIRAAINSVAVGEYTGQMLADMVTKEGLDASNLHLIGHSLGGQGMGHAGRTLEDLTGSKAIRLTGDY